MSLNIKYLVAKLKQAADTNTDVALTGSEARIIQYLCAHAVRNAAPDVVDPLDTDPSDPNKKVF